MAVGERFHVLCIPGVIRRLKQHHVVLLDSHFLTPFAGASSDQEVIVQRL
jgi:hypothetical protein